MKQIIKITESDLMRLIESKLFENVNSSNINNKLEEFIIYSKLKHNIDDGKLPEDEELLKKWENLLNIIESYYKNILKSSYKTGDKNIVRKKHKDIIDFLKINEENLGIIMFDLTEYARNLIK